MGSTLRPWVSMHLKEQDSKYSKQTKQTADKKREKTLFLSFFGIFNGPSAFKQEVSYEFSFGPKSLNNGT